MRLTAQYEFPSAKHTAEFLARAGLLLYAWSSGDVGAEWPLCRVWCARNEVLRVTEAAHACQGMQVSDWAEDEQKS